MKSGSMSDSDLRQRTRWQLRFGGMGGQGVVVMGDTIALAGALAHWHAAGSTSYGAQARGGASNSDVVLSREPIDFPHVEQPDVLVLVSQEAYEVYTAAEPRPPLVIVDSFVVTTHDLGPGVRQLEVDATQLALDALDNRQGANFVMLGALLGATGILTLEQVDAAIESKLRPGWWDLNKRALRIGHEAVEARC
jgi:2-oxoglutarate ferredoxin oxidoreductase subunit gamma